MWNTLDVGDHWGRWRWTLHCRSWSCKVKAASKETIEEFCWNFSPMWHSSSANPGHWGEERARQFIKAHYLMPSWDHDDPEQTLKKAVRNGNLIPVLVKGPTYASRPSQSNSTSSQPTRQYSNTITPSQLFRGKTGIASDVGTYASALPKLAAEDGMAIWLAKPGDVLPDGTIATPLADAQPFEYAPDTVIGDVEDLAASTGNPDYAAKMLGYDRDTFGKILHVFKPENGLGPADNVIWHDNGDVYFNGNFVANFHDWAN